MGTIWKKTFKQRVSKVEKKQMNNMNQEIPVKKKSNVTVIALAVICIILAASLVGVTAVYVNNQSQITSKDKTIASLNDNITSLQFDLSQAQSQTANVTTYALEIACT